MPFSTKLDVLIMGGGIAGLWLLDDLRRRGYAALLVESRALGSGQTVASQGILHGGVKHAIVGRPGTFVNALKEMPQLWRECLDGTREPDLRAVRLRSPHCLLWRTDSVKSAFTMLGARFVLRTPLTIVPATERSAALAGSPGSVLRIDEQVVDPASLVAVLAERNRKYLLHGGNTLFTVSEPGTVRAAEVVSPDESVWCDLRPRHVVFTAGEGNASLRRACDLSDGAMRLLPLPILVVSGDLPDLNGFCLDGTRAKVIVTTQRVSAHHATWQVATERPAPDDPDAFEAMVMKELRDALPGFPWPVVSIRSYVANRAESSEGGLARSSDVSLRLEGNVITAWPTKLVLAPRLAQGIIKLLPAPSVGHDPASDVRDWPRPPTADYPWSHS